MRRLVLPVDGSGRGRIGLGTAALGRPAYLTTGHGEDLRGRTSIAAMATNASEVFDLAHELGVRYIDTARSYGRAEEFLASWLDDRGHDDVFVASKWGYEYVGGWRIDAAVHETKDHSVDAFRRQLAETRALLGDRLGLYQIHSVTPESSALEDRQLLDELAGLRTDGVAIGLSTSGPHQADVLRRAAAIEVDGAPLFDAAQVTWNLLEQSTTPVLRELADEGLTIIVKEAMANGRLSSVGDRVDVTGGAEDPPEAVALAAALTRPFADVVLSGALTTDQLRNNLVALNTTIDPALLDRAAMDPEEYWSQRAGRDWT